VQLVRIQLTRENAERRTSNGRIDIGSKCLRDGVIVPSAFLGEKLKAGCRIRETEAATSDLLPGDYSCRLLEKPIQFFSKVLDRKGCLDKLDQSISLNALCSHRAGYSYSSKQNTKLHCVHQLQSRVVDET
jgi:hypothetical protein